MGRPVDEKDYCARAKFYAQQVCAGKVKACKWVRLACRRQLNDLQRKDWEWKFDKVRAEHICKFMEKLPHVKGRWKTRTIKLEDHQCFRFTAIFGWVHKKTGFRRFRKALIVLPRKNAKTTEAAGVGLYLLALDGEPGAEVYAAAVTKDQVTGPSGVWTIGKRMAERSPVLQSRYGVEPMAHSIVIESEASYFKPLARDANPNEGLNIHGAIIDELHAHKTREIFDVIDDGTGAREQPLIYIISTEGDNAAGVFAEQVNYAQQVLEGRHEDDSYFGIVYTIDPEDDWTSPEAWRKANPNLGVSVFEKDLEIRCRQAQKNAASQSSFLTKRLNVRVGAGDAYFNMLAWKNVCEEKSLRIEDFYGQHCVIALDLASNTDMAAKVITFKYDRGYAVFGKFYLPEDAVERGNPNYDFYRGWAEKGLLTLTPGNVIDFEFIEQDVLEDIQNFDVVSIPYDPANATYLVTRLMAAGAPMETFPQNVMRMSDPMKHLGAMVLSGRIKHDDNHILSWMMGNVTAKPDVKDNVYPRKARNENKIDGAVALIMATGVWLKQPESQYITPHFMVV